MTTVLVTAAITAAIIGPLCWWIGRKGGMAVMGDVRIAAQDIERKA